MSVVATHEPELCGGGGSGCGMSGSGVGIGGGGWAIRGFIPGVCVSGARRGLD